MTGGNTTAESDERIVKNPATNKPPISLGIVG
jgi:hypothetical protein